MWLGQPSLSSVTAAYQVAEFQLDETLVKSQKLDDYLASGAGRILSTWDYQMRGLKA